MSQIITKNCKPTALSLLEVHIKPLMIEVYISKYFRLRTYDHDRVDLEVY